MTQQTWDLTSETAKSDAILAKRAEKLQLKRDTKSVNDALYGMGRTYHESVPLDAINGLLVHYGFKELDAMMLCGREGRLHEDVGRNRWLALTWYRMESNVAGIAGRYEVVAYVS